VLLPVVFAGLPSLPLQSSATVRRPAEGPYCLNCGVGRVETRWQEPRASSRELPDLWWWRRRITRAERLDSS
jgi:hypothetical protein